LKAREKAPDEEEPRGAKLVVLKKEMLRV